MKELIPLIEKGFEVRHNIEGNNILYGIHFEGTKEYLILTKPHKKDNEGFRSLENEGYFDKRTQILRSILTDSKNKGFKITTGIDAYEKFTQLPESGDRFIRFFFNISSPLRPYPPNKDADLLVKWFEKEYQFELKGNIANSLRFTEKTKVQFRLFALNKLIENRLKEYENKPGCTFDERIANTSFIQYLKTEIKIASAVIETNNEQIITAFNNDVNREVKYCKTFEELYHYSVSQGLEKDENKELNAVAKANDENLMHLLFNLWLNEKYHLQTTEQNDLALLNFDNYKTFFKEYMEMENSKKRELENSIKKNRIEVGLASNESENQTVQPNKIKWLGSPEQFGYVFGELVSKGYIELPTKETEGSFAKLSELCLQYFEIHSTKGKSTGKQTTKENLERAINPQTNQLNIKAKELLKFPIIDHLR